MATVKKKMMFKAYTDWQTQYGDRFKMFLVREPVVVTAGQPALGMHAHLAIRRLCQVLINSHKIMTTFFEQQVL